MKTARRRERKSFSKIDAQWNLQIPNLLEVQLKSFRDLGSKARPVGSSAGASEKAGALKESASPRASPMESLLTCPIGTPLKVTRVTDQDPGFLRFIESNDLKPGQPVQVETRDAAHAEQIFQAFAAAGYAPVRMPSDTAME